MFKQLRSIFLTGLFVLLPLIITLELLFWGLRQADAIIGGMIATYFKTKIPGLGLGILLFFIIITGILARNYIGKKCIAFGERMLNKIPIFKSIYNITKQITGILSKKDQEAFRKVVLVEYPRKGIYSPGFLTGEAPFFTLEPDCSKMLSVFIPTVPNPTTGFLIFVPEAEVTILDMSIEDGFKLIISAGVIKPTKLVAL